jgi:hypothetical protein
MTRRRSFLSALWVATGLLGLSFMAPHWVRSAETPTNQLLAPLGGNSTIPNGDYVSIAASPGLGTYLSFYIEVPPGVGQLGVDIFDADTGGGGSHDLQMGGSFNTNTNYTLFDPAGATVSSWSVAGGTCGACDNAWTSLPLGGANYRDEFNAATFSNNDGTLNWTTNWIEVDGNGLGPTTGNARTTGGVLSLDDNPNTFPNPSLERQANLSSFSTASFSFSFAISSGVDNSDSVLVQVSANGGGSWTTLENFTNYNNATSGTRNYNITAYRATNTRVRFAVNSGYTSSNEVFSVDDVDVSGGGGTLSNPTAGHWQLRVDTSGGGDDVNAFGIRAHDGDSGAGGVELNIYAESYVVPGRVGGGTNLYDYFPYVTSGCQIDANDFDSDGAATLSVTSRLTLFSQSFTSGQLSGLTEWANNTLSGWTTDDASADYGVWHADFDITTPGGGAGNISTFYMGAFNAANPPNGGLGPPPTAQPESNTLRLYFPTDGSSPAAGPDKPIVEQFLSHVSGPNPPVAGNTSRVAVTLSVTNPTVHPIVFSTPSRLVTARVPGGNAVYAGNPLASQGSVTSQPSIGGSGNVVWNPGTVLSGDRATLTYEIDVTPPSSGARVPVTGTPGANGTTATYLDETGNTTQTRATFTFGPLCELAVVEGVQTLAVVSSFAAYEEKNQVAVRWVTGAEAGTAGFYLYRWDALVGEWQIVNNEIVPSVDAPQGGSYVLMDPTAPLDEFLDYVLVEVETSGRTRVHGPYQVSVGESPLPDRAQRRARRARAQEQKLAARQLKQFSRARRTFGVGVDAIKIGVGERGVHFVSKLEITEGLETDDAQVRKMIGSGQLHLTQGGEEVSWWAAPGGSGIFFFGEELESPHSDENVYWLRAGRGSPTGSVRPRGRRTTASQPSTFAERTRFEEDKTPGLNLPLDPDSDFWLWDFITAGDPDHGAKTFTLNAPGVAGPTGTLPEAKLTVKLQGGLSFGSPAEHRFTASVNGHLVGESYWSGTDAHAVTFEFPQAFLQDGDNSVEITGILSPGVFLSIFYVDSFELDYQRVYRAIGDELEFTSAGFSEVQVSGFTDSSIVALDITDPRRPLAVSGLTVEETETGFTAHFYTAAGERYIAVSNASLKSPTSVWQDLPSELRESQNRADYVVIAPAELAAAAGRLADYRRTQGLRSVVVEIEDVFDEFNHGISSPLAIRDFLRYAYENWDLPPRYVVLAGKGTFDYKEFAGFGENLVPPLMLSSETGLVPTDNRYGDLLGDDGIPEVAVGRIPVLTEEALDAYIDKVQGFEGTFEEDWSERALMIADNPETGADFIADSERVAALIPNSFAVERVYLYGDVEAARDLLFETWNQGVAFVNYVGHGSLQSLTTDGLMDSADVPFLENTSGTPVVTTMTCMINRFDIPGFTSLGEELVLKETGGAVAVWGPTGLSNNSKAAMLNDRFYRMVFHSGEAVLGDAILRTLDSFRGADSVRPTLEVFQLLGDPALRLHVPPPPPPESDPGSETDEL